MTTPSYTSRAVRVVTQAARAEHDFGGWLASVLAQVAGMLGSSDALTAGRPGSWEASLVDELVKGTVGFGDDYLPRPPGRRGKLTDAQVREIRDQYAFEFPPPTQQQLADKYGVSPRTISAIVTRKTWKWLT